MAIQLQMLFGEYEKKQLQARIIKSAINDQIMAHPKYQEVRGNLDIWKAEMKQIEAAVKEDLGKDADDLESLKVDISGKKEMLTDLAINKLREGNSIEIEIEGVKYEPVFSVNFKKSKKQYESERN